MGKSAQDSTGFRFSEGGGNDIGSYKQPMENPNDGSEATVFGNYTPSSINISVGNVSKGAAKGVNPYGVKEMRGYGAATKGRKISGKQG